MCCAKKNNNLHSFSFGPFSRFIFRWDYRHARHTHMRLPFPNNSIVFAQFFRLLLMLLVAFCQCRWQGTHWRMTLRVFCAQDMCAWETTVRERAKEQGTIDRIVEFTLGSNDVAICAHSSSRSTEKSKWPALESESIFNNEKGMENEKENELENEEKWSKIKPKQCVHQKEKERRAH